MEATILCSRVSWEEKVLLKQSEKEGLKLNLAFINDLSLPISAECSGLRQDWKQKLVLQRVMGFFDAYYSTALLENWGVQIINSFKTISLCGDKIITSLNLLRRKVPTPKTFVAFDKEQALKTMEKIGFPCILKPSIGSWGRLVAKVNDYESGKAVLEDRELLGNSYQKVYYVQEYIKNTRDIRVFVVGDEVVAAMYRYNAEKDWRSNLAVNGKAIKCKITPEITEISLKASDAVYGEIVGIDLIEKGDKLLVHEVNHSPQFRGLTFATGQNIAGKIISYLREKLKK